MDFQYKDYPLEIRIFRASVLKSVMQIVQAQNNRNNHKWLQYVNSTRARFNFSTWMVHSFYSNRKLTAAMMTVEMGISRKAVDEMVKDWEEEGWLYKEKGEGIDKHKYFLHPAEEILHINDEWFQWYEDSIFPVLLQSFTFYENSKKSIKNLQYAVDFNTNSGANLSGIEDTVTELILNGSKQRKKG